MLGTDGGDDQQPRRAVLIIHGIGTQQPFQALDSFVNGLQSADPPMTVTHFRFWQEKSLGNFVRLQGKRSLDIYEFYWASMTAGKSSFPAVVHWLASTGFTPLRRVAFNLPLLIHRARDNAKREDTSWSSSIAEQKYAVSWGKFCGLVIAYSFIELMRVVITLLSALLLAGLAATLVSSSSTLLKDLSEAVRTVKHTEPWRDALTAFLFMSVLAATASLILSFPQQVRDLIRAWSIRPRRVLHGFLLEIIVWCGRQLFSQIARVAPFVALAVLFVIRVRRERAVTKWEKLIENPYVKGIWSTVERWAKSKHETRIWGTEIGARLLFVLFSGGALLVLYLLMAAMLKPEPPGIGNFHLTPFVYNLYTQLGDSGLLNLALILGLILLGVFLKRVFVDYMADVALYTTADEKSLFAQTRREILDGATSRARWLLRHYGSVAIAGHSLGSVVGYDLINRLRSEVWVGDFMAARQQGNRQEIERLLKNLPTQDAQRVSSFLDELEQQSDRSNQEAITPVCTKELQRLDTLITFGSPLNKVLYFFRTLIKPYQTVRAHILNKLYSFRRPQELLTTDYRIQNGVAIGADYRALDATAKDPLESLYWLNVYSPFDPVSARLIFYENVYEYRRWYWLPGFCHMSYWHDLNFYAEVLAALDHKPKNAKLRTGCL